MVYQVLLVSIKLNTIIKNILLQQCQGNHFIKSFEKYQDILDQLHKIKNLMIYLDLFFIGIFSPIYLMNYAVGDNASYISHEFSTGLDGDLNYQNEPVTDFSRNNVLPRHPIGSGLLASPFVALFSLIDRIMDHPIIYNHKDFLNSWSYFGFFFSVSVYFFLGIIFNLKAIKMLNIMNNDLINKIKYMK